MNQQTKIDITMRIKKLKSTFILMLLSLSSLAQNTTYKGTIPCADCEGIIYILSLSTDNFYKEVIIYKGKNAMPITAAGNYTIKNGFITLDKTSGAMNYFKQEGNDLLMLDINGQVIGGNLASAYLLENETPNAGNRNSAAMTPFINNRENTKQKSGIDFYAFGNEPSWSLDIDFENNMHFKNSDGRDIITAAGKGEKAMDANVIRYASKNGTAFLSIQIMQQGCTDPMSGEKFAYSVSVETKNNEEAVAQHFTGCGKYITNEKLNGTWTIKSIDGKPITNAKQFMNGMPKLEINLDAKSYSGTSGCNSFSGKLVIEGTTIRFGNMAATEMYCNGNSFEQNYFKALNESTNYSLKNGDLLLSNANKTTLIFTKNNMPNSDKKNLESNAGSLQNLNTSWVLESMGDIKVKAENYLKGLPQIQFNTSTMQYTGSTGCNSINGKFEADAKKIKVFTGAMTRMYCEGANEPEFLKLLHAVNTYSITNNKLSLSENGKPIMVFRKED